MAEPPRWRTQSDGPAERQALGGMHRASLPSSSSSLSSLTMLSIAAPFVHRDMLAYVLSLRSLRSLHLATHGNAFAYQPAADDGRGLTDAHLLALQFLPQLSELRLDGLPMLTLLSLAALSFCRRLRCLVIQRCNGLSWADRHRLALRDDCGTVSERDRDGADGLDVVQLCDNDALPDTCATDVRRMIGHCANAVRLSVTEGEEARTKMPTRTLNLAHCTMSARLGDVPTVDDNVDGTTRTTQVDVAVAVGWNSIPASVVDESRPQRPSIVERLSGFFSRLTATK